MKTRASSGGVEKPQEDAKKGKVATKKQMAPPCNTDTTNYNMRKYDWLQSVQECPVYKPSFDEFEDPLQYIQSIANEASEFGICKIIPPLAPKRPASMVLREDFKFKTTVQPLQANNGKIVYDKGRIRTLAEFEVEANKFMKERYGSHSLYQSPGLLEIEFWHELLEVKKNRVEYGINIEGTGFSDPLGSSLWNLKTLPKLPNCLLRHVERPIEGVTTPMLYIGMLFGTFAWHVEDNYLYSINYHHCGAPKTWYGVPGKHATQLEELVQSKIFNSQIQNEAGTSQETNGAQVLAKKTTMFPPNMLQENGLMVSRATQGAGEFVITFPRAYHGGFSNGFNIGEAVNFAPYDWVEFGNLAARNYALSKTLGVVSYAEIIFKECMSFDEAALTMNQKELAVSFSILGRLHKVARWCLLQSPPKDLQTFKKSEDIVLCSRCGRDCYFSYLTHKECSDPVCILHDWSNFKDCELYLHKDIDDIENKSKLFGNDNEVEQRVLDKVVEDITSDASFKWMLKSLVERVVSL